ncbi:MAG TPA: class II fructose-bisphosphate aldolase [Symbiobacteriaceae bacterium]
MPLVNGRDLLADALRSGYAVGAFNVSNMESAQAVIQAAVAERAPVIVQVWSGIVTSGYADMAVLTAMLRTMAQQAPVPVCVHLDHGMDPGMVKEAARIGFSSVMIDASDKPFDQNVAITRDVVETSHRLGVPVEAELGHVGSGERPVDGDTALPDLLLTDPEEAERFVQETGCDSLAVAIGTAHGKYTFSPQLDIPRLEEIRRRVSIPLVLHGSSYTPDDQIVAAIAHGIAKINVATELSEVWLDTVLGIAAQRRPRYPEDLLTPAKEAVCERVRAKIRLFGSAGKAG